MATIPPPEGVEPVMPDATPKAPSPLSFPDYRYFWFARFTAVMATMAMVVVIGYQLYDTARTDYGMSIREASFQLGLLGLVQFVPLAILTPVAGWVADRFERRKVAIFANMIDLVIAVLLGWFTWIDGLTLPLLFALAALHGVARVFVGPAMSAIAPNIVPPAVLPRAIAMSSIAWQSASVVGPAAGGLIYAAHPASVYVFAAILLAVSAFTISRVRPVLPPPTEVRRHPLREMADGLQFTWRERFLLGTITLDLFAVILSGATALLPVFARDILQTGSEGLGFLRAAPALGAAVVALGLAFRPIERNVGVKMLWAVAVFGAGTVAFGFSTNFFLSLGLLVLMGAADMFSVFVRGTLIQLNTPDHMRGRVSAVSGLAISASNELGEMRAGTMAAFMGPVGAVVIGGAGAIVVTALWAWLFPELRRARTFAPQFKAGST
ncbi:MFS transporter [Sphingopyxis bauzanensis]|uniref:Multidrug efflux pump Tap n=1 Tax=Sphingopyxis bauzanensis TaxID=651663 RepID=A0A246K194_9SPHN|nr:MFS transporter [Sphingopyxis bauzanensis]MDP3783546.1 MFS transporter [Sphingopyxis sp.]OWQ98737.1 MFS transporter [Sphingopyxis bauzanensis]GGJ64266.1 MFS transporter [Sphingopyxis bauzanensis]